MAPLGAVLLALIAATGHDQQVPTFTAETGLVNLVVSVMDARRAYVTGLVAEDFSVFEDGERRPVVQLFAEELHLDLVIVIDSSASMRRSLPMVSAAARRLVDSVKHDDHVEVITFSGGVYRACSFTSDRGTIEQALAFRTASDDGSRVFRALADSFREVRAHDEERQRRSAIVLFTDGLDNDPFADEEWLRREASLAGTPVFVLRRPVAVSDNTTGDYRHPITILEKLARETGGTSLLLDSPYAITNAFSRIGAELKAQYRIGFEPSDRNRDGRWRNIQVIVNGRTSLKATHRLRYFVPALRSSTTLPR